MFTVSGIELPEELQQLLKRSWKDWKCGRRFVAETDYVKFYDDLKIVLNGIDSGEYPDIYCVWLITNLYGAQGLSYGQWLSDNFAAMTSVLAGNLERSEPGVDGSPFDVDFDPIEKGADEKDLSPEELESILSVFEGARVRVRHWMPNVNVIHDTHHLRGEVHVDEMKSFCSQFEECIDKLSKFGRVKATGSKKSEEFVPDVEICGLDNVEISVSSPTTKIEIRIFVHATKLNPRLDIINELHLLARTRHTFFSPIQHITSMMFEVLKCVGVDPRLSARFLAPDRILRVEIVNRSGDYEVIIYARSLGACKSTVRIKN